MKLNWGTGIAIVLGLFAISMGYAVYKAVQQDYQLVTTDYYAEELAYQHRIDQKKNAVKLASQPVLTWTDKGLVIEFPAELQGQKVNAEVEMYCLINSEQDFTISEENWSVADLALPAAKFSKGRWTAKITLEDENTGYYFDPEIVIP